MHRDRRLQAGQGRLRAGDVHQHRCGPISDEFVKRQKATAQQAEAAARAASREARKRGASSASQRRVADAAREEVSREFQRQIIQLALRYGLTGLPTIDNADFVSSLVFDTSTGQVGQPKGKFAFLFPSNDAALIRSAAPRPEQLRAAPGHQADQGGVERPGVHSQERRATS